MNQPNKSIASTHKGPQDSVGFRFWQAFLSWQRSVDVVLAPYDLTQPTFSILAIAGWLSEQNRLATNHTTVRQKIIVEMSQLPKMQVSQLLQRLLTSGLIQVEPYSMDRRERLVVLTPKGWTLLKTTMPLVEATDRETLARVRID
jgi:DNA-binding MarR family transcriptional regulator